ncbi:hypothetical protein F8568_040320 [Actinomadura sp. LD22]|uniref:SAF domain-containing protein n=1 Tax=Actinomadura physcomitrii TaxID=2650748 RepID=A0A6I4MT23_9ACTN|nr:SAF domain-containing protein [Actinomadura physcomitrii]MWA06491.1 hypothetical protein [Actinomadura physcomitrii]
MALAVIATVVNVGVYRASDQRVAVVRLARDVPSGHQLVRSDLDVTRAAVDATVPTVPERQLPQVVGKRTAKSLSKGTLLAGSQLTAQAVPGKGQALVTVPLKAGSMPLGLTPGWRVQAVFTTGAQDRSTDDGAPLGSDRSSADEPGNVQAVVEEVGAANAEGTVPVQLLVADSDAMTVARKAADGLVVLIVTERLG